VGVLTVAADGLTVTAGAAASAAGVLTGAADGLTVAAGAATSATGRPGGAGLWGGLHAALASAQHEKRHRRVMDRSPAIGGIYLRRCTLWPRLADSPPD